MQWTDVAKYRFGRLLAYSVTARLHRPLGPPSAAGGHGREPRWPPSPMVPGSGATPASAAGGHGREPRRPPPPRAPTAGSRAGFRRRGRHGRGPASQRAKSSPTAGESSTAAANRTPRRRHRLQPPSPSSMA
uniref:Uncharacterized protein n=1 Tax=Setaria viridis TaxID=4556 RepID=A0A4U6VGL9_SETVI|nr:hypothetical protein SEVIR_3G347250v2 [Setaria viridis]